MSDDLSELSNDELLQKLADARWSVEYDIKQIEDTKQREKEQPLADRILFGPAVDPKIKQNELNSFANGMNEVARLENEVRRRRIK